MPDGLPQPPRIQVAEARREDHKATDAALPAFLRYAGDRERGDCHHHEVGNLRQCRHGGVGAQARDPVGMRVHWINRTVEIGFEQMPDNGIADTGLAPARTDDRH